MEETERTENERVLLEARKLLLHEAGIPKRKARIMAKEWQDTGCTLREMAVWLDQGIKTAAFMTTLAKGGLEPVDLINGTKGKDGKEHRIGDLIESGEIDPIKYIDDFGPAAQEAWQKEIEEKSKKEEEEEKETLIINTKFPNSWTDEQKESYTKEQKALMEKWMGEGSIIIPKAKA